MNPILRSLVYLALIFFTIFVAIKPYNWICHLSKKCNEIVFDNLIPGVEGNQEITAIMEVIDQRDDIEFEVDEPKMLHTVSGRKNIVTYHIQNISKDTVKIRPKFSVEPKEAEKYISRQECLCFREYKLKKGEAILVPTSFKFKSKLDQEIAEKKIGSKIRIIYTATK